MFKDTIRCSHSCNLIFLCTLTLFSLQQHYSKSLGSMNILRNYEMRNLSHVCCYQLYNTFSYSYSFHIQTLLLTGITYNTTNNYTQNSTSAYGGPRSLVCACLTLRSAPYQLLFHPKSYFLCDLKPHAKFWNPTITPSGRGVCGKEKKNKK